MLLLNTHLDNVLTDSDSDSYVLLSRCTQEAKRGLGTSAVFIARNRFAVLDKASGTIQIRNLQNEITKKCAPPNAGVDAVFYAGTGVLLCRSEDKVCAHGGVHLVHQLPWPC